MPVSKRQRLQMQDRRRRVATLFLAHATQQEIADQLGIARRTVVNDVKWLRELWQREMLEDPVAMRAQELAELNDMERDCIRAYQLSRDRGWIAERRMIKERKAKLVGLDAPTKQEHSGPGGEPLQRDVTVLIDALADPNIRDRLDDLAERLEGQSGGNGC